MILPRDYMPRNPSRHGERTKSDLVPKRSYYPSLADHRHRFQTKARTVHSTIYENILQVEPSRSQNNHPRAIFLPEKGEMMNISYSGNSTCLSPIIPCFQGAEIHADEKQGSLARSPMTDKEIDSSDHSTRIRNGIEKQVLPATHNQNTNLPASLNVLTKVMKKDTPHFESPKLFPSTLECDLTSEDIGTNRPPQARPPGAFVSSYCVADRTKIRLSPEIPDYGRVPVVEICEMWENANIGGRAIRVYKDGKIAYVGKHCSPPSTIEEGNGERTRMGLSSGNPTLR